MSVKDSKQLKAKDKEQLESEILHCCREGNLNYLKVLLATWYQTKDSAAPKYININEPLGMHREYTLHVASENNRITIIQYLIETAKATVDVKSKKDGSTALLLAAGHGFLDIVKYLVVKGANIDYQRPGGFTALIEACDGGHLDVVSYLVEAGAEKNTMVTHSRTTAMTRALLKGHYPMVKFLYNHHASFSFEKLENAELIKEVQKRFNHFLVHGMETKEGEGELSLDRQEGSSVAKLSSSSNTKPLNSAMDSTGKMESKEEQKNISHVSSSDPVPEPLLVTPTIPVTGLCAPSSLPMDPQFTSSPALESTSKSTDESEPREPLISRKQLMTHVDVVPEMKSVQKLPAPNDSKTIAEMPELQVPATESVGTQMLEAPNTVPTLCVNPQARVAVEPSSSSAEAPAVTPQHNLIPEAVVDSPTYFQADLVPPKRGKKPIAAKTTSTVTTVPQSTAKSSKFSKPTAPATPSANLDYKALYIQQLKKNQELQQTVRAQNILKTGTVPKSEVAANMQRLKQEHQNQFSQWQREKEQLQQQLRNKSLSYFETKEQYARYQHHSEVLQLEYDFLQSTCVDLCDQMLEEVNRNLSFFQEYRSRKKMRKS